MQEVRNKPVVSVIIPTYNRAHLIGRAIRSVLNQTYTDFELIVVDDASTDNTEEIVKSFKEHRIRYLCHETNRGGSAARNTGIKASHGEYVAFLDADDEWLPCHLERKLGLLNTESSCGVVGSFYIISKGKITDNHCLPKPSDMNMAEYILSKKGDARTSTFLFHRKVLSQLLFDEQLGKHQDWDLAIRFDNKSPIVMDTEASVILHTDSDDRMSTQMNHEATGIFLGRYKQDLSVATLSRFYLILALLTLEREGRNRHFRNYLIAGQELRKGASWKIRFGYRVISIPILGNIFVWLFEQYVELKRLACGIRSEHIDLLKGTKI